MVVVFFVILCFFVITRLLICLFCLVGFGLLLGLHWLFVVVVVMFIILLFY